MNPHTKGFTLVETLVAITILLIAIVGPLYAVHRSLVASYTARDSLTAIALAQEGLEYVRRVRDTNYLSNQSGWLNGLGACEGAQGCMIDPNATSNQVRAYSASNAVLRLDGSYRYTLESTGTITRFTRRVTITVQPSGNEANVSTTVSWSTFRIPYSVTVTERLYNWQ